MSFRGADNTVRWTSHFFFVWSPAFTCFLFHFQTMRVWLFIKILLRWLYYSLYTLALYPHDLYVQLAWSLGSIMSRVTWMFVDFKRASQSCCSVMTTLSCQQEEKEGEEQIPPQYTCEETGEEEVDVTEPAEDKAVTRLRTFHSRSFLMAFWRDLVTHHKIHLNFNSW